jgi:hypothetical protein
MTLTQTYGAGGEVSHCPGGGSGRLSGDEADEECEG